MKFYKYLTLLLFFIIAACSNIVEKSTQNNEKQYEISLNNKRFKQFKKFENWTFIEERNSSCYIYSFPSSSYGNYIKRGLHYIGISYNKKPKNNESYYGIYVVGGKAYNQNMYTKLTIDNQDFLFVNVSAESWSSDEEALIEMLSVNDKFTVLSAFADNTVGADTYLLKGFNDAFLHLSNVC